MDTRARARTGRASLVAFFFAVVMMVSGGWVIWQGTADNGRIAQACEDTGGEVRKILPPSDVTPPLLVSSGCYDQDGQLLFD